MTKIVPLVDALVADTIASIALPATFNAKTTTGLDVIVPDTAVVGDYVELNADGTSPSGVAVVYTTAQIVVVGG